MKYDFTTILCREGKDALAVDALGQGWAPGKPREGFDPIPMWVADMNFTTVPTITQANWQILPLHIEFQGAHVIDGE